MATGYITSSTLIETIKREGMIPTSQSTFQDSDFLAMANQEMRVGLVPSILQYHEEYFARDSAPIPLVANQSKYAIPYRAIGGKFRELFYLDTNNNLRAMSRISADHRPYYNSNSNNDIIGGSFIYYFVEGNEIVIVPSIGSSPVGSLIFTFYMRPNELVDESRISTITGISVGASTTVYTVASIPTTATATQSGVSVTGFTTATQLDLMQRNPGHKTISFDLLPTAVNTTLLTITFNNDDLDEGVVLGDYISFAGECIIPQVPSDLQDVLSQRVVLRCLQAFGDKDGYGMASKKLGEMESATGVLVRNRSEGQAKKVVNMHGTLRTSRYFGRW